MYIYIIVFNTLLFFHSNILQRFPVQTLRSGTIGDARCQARLYTILWCRCSLNLTLMGNCLNIELYRTQLVNAVNTSYMIHCSYTQGCQDKILTNSYSASQGNSCLSHRPNLTTVSEVKWQLFVISTELIPFTVLL